MARFASLLRLGLVVAASLWLAHCTGNATQPAKTAAATPGEPADANAGAVPSAPAIALASVDSVEYRIAPRDILEINVFQVPDLNKSAQVNEDGVVTLPLVGKVPLGGKTTHEAEQILSDRLKKGYLQSPQVSIMVKQYGQRATVNGEVKAPRVLTLDGRVTLSEAVASAGGLSDLANSHRVHIARVTGQQVQDDLYDLEAIQGGRGPDPVLHGGDIVVVEQSGSAVALKNVKDLLPFAIFANLF